MCRVMCTVTIDEATNNCETTKVDGGLTSSRYSPIHFKKQNQKCLRTLAQFVTHPVMRLDQTETIVACKRSQIVLHGREYGVIYR